jgi:hypothetical protein
LINLPLDIFGRLNSYAVILNEQEKLNANHFGPFKILADKLGRKYNEWTNQKIFTANEILRMAEVNILLICMKEGIKAKKQISKYYGLYEKNYEDSVDEVELRFDDVISMRSLISKLASVLQCENLIANAHKTDHSGVAMLPTMDQQQITVAAFLNVFIAWESFLEESLAQLMIGEKTTSGAIPVRFVAPPTLDSARQLTIGVKKYFDYGNHQHFKTMARIYFEKGYPYEPHLSAIISELDDLRTMRNSCAHISSSTRRALESLATGIFGQPRPGITRYQLLPSTDPRSKTAETVFSAYKNKLVVTAEIIAQGK